MFGPYILINLKLTSPRTRSRTNKLHYHWLLVFLLNSQFFNKIRTPLEFVLLPSMNISHSGKVVLKLCISALVKCVS